nr:WD40 repeat domain-containing protein [Endozoicomonas sp.]
MAIASGKNVKIFTSKNDTWLNTGSIEHQHKFICPPNFSPDSRKLVIGTQDNKALVCDFHEDQLSNILIKNAKPGSSRFSHDNHLATYNVTPTDTGWISKRTLFFSDEQNNFLKRISNTYQDAIKTIRFSPDDRFLLTVLQKSVMIRKLEGSNQDQLLISISKGEGVDEIIESYFSPNSCTLVTSSTHKINIHVLGKKRETWEPHRKIDIIGNMGGCAFSPDSQSLVYATRSGFSYILVCDKGNWEINKLIPETYDHIMGGFNHNGSCLVLCTDDRLSSLIFTRKKAGGWIKEQEIRHLAEIIFTRFISNDRHLMVTSQKNNTATIYTLNEKDLFVKSDQVTHYVGQRPEIYPDQQRLIVSKDNSACILTVDQAGLLKEQQKLPHESSVRHIKLSPDGRTLATASDHIFRIFMERDDSVQPEPVTAQNLQEDSDRMSL